MSPGDAVTSVDALLEVRDLRTHFSLDQSALERAAARIGGRAPRVLRAVDGVSFDLARGETLGLVGESGCGKTTLGRSVLRLIAPTAGEVRFKGIAVNELTPSQLRALRPRMQIVFQDPGGALNPRRTIGAAVGRALDVIGIKGTRAQAALRADLLKSVGLRPELESRYPHQLSGGQKQRACIARALATEPDFIVADEPVSSLDVSVQAQILNLLTELQRERGVAVLFISHDLSVVRQVSHRIAVMYAGRIMEIGPARQVVDGALHPYTQQLLEAVPRLHHHWDTEPVSAVRSSGSSYRPEIGCPCRARCPAGQHEWCQNLAPELVEVAPGHSVACHDVTPPPECS
jgi:oligopeptide transport system ATP-binding protein